MIIFGTSGITSVEKKGTYHCPACGAGAGFQHKSIRRFFSLFFIPMIPLNKVADFIECSRCGGSFKPEVLNWGGSVPPSPEAGPLPPPIPGYASKNPFVQASPSGPEHSGNSSTTVSYQGNGMAKASMILGIVGLVTASLFCPSFIFCILSVIFGIVGLNRVKQGQGLVGGKNQAIAGIACSLVGFLIMGGMMIVAARQPEKKREVSTRIGVTSGLSTVSETKAEGNSPKAIELAQKYSDMMSAMQQIAFASEKGKAPKDAKYVVHCQIHEGSCAFIAAVPEYRKFTDEAKESLEEYAWTAAREILKTNPEFKDDTKLCVALKGVINFGSVMTGTLGVASPQTKSKEEEDMERFFKEPAIKAEVE